MNHMPTSMKRTIYNLRVLSRPLTCKVPLQSGNIERVNPVNPRVITPYHSIIH